MLRGDGVACPVCGSVISKVVSKTNRDDTFRRYRKCRNGHNFVTTEVVVESLSGRMEPGQTIPSPRNGFTCTGDNT